jgi:hypothetical protein
MPPATSLVIPPHRVSVTYKVVDSAGIVVVSSDLQAVCIFAFGSPKDSLSASNTLQRYLNNDTHDRYPGISTAGPLKKYRHKPPSHARLASSSTADCSPSSFRQL